MPEIKLFFLHFPSLCLHLLLEQVPACSSLLSESITHRNVHVAAASSTSGFLNLTRFPKECLSVAGGGRARADGSRVESESVHRAAAHAASKILLNYTLFKPAATI